MSNTTISREEWADWKINPVTKAFFAACAQRVEDCKDILIQSAGQDPRQDGFYVGFAAAYTEMPQFRIDDLEDEDGN